MSSLPRAEQLRLYSEWEEFALTLARWFRRRLPHHVGLDDLEAAARRGLWEAAINVADADHPGLKWYVQARVRGAILDELRRSDWSTRRMRKAGAAAEVLYLEQIGYVESQSQALRVESSVESEIDSQWKEAALERALARLPAREEGMFRKALGGMRYVDIAASMGISEARVSQLMSRARKHVSSELARYR